ncbi:hypothetical protein H4W34_006702 [Actinomadura algeriensis]|uniref:6-phosphogluconate dehydrogenase NADP-binding domain-containing protein n=2 Tax=Actinomadura algeriensis TaxID=1679523 RepID=A0ABR9K1X9_9ACTN|nr:hypothetical protein [Actinomadura algeriensis]
MQGQWAVVQNTHEVGNDPSLRAIGRIAEVVDAEGTTRRLVASPVQFNREAPRLTRGSLFAEHTDESVGFIGLGGQGAPMARRIVEAGLPTTLWARRPETVEPFAGTAAEIAASPAEPGGLEGHTLAPLGPVAGALLRKDARLVVDLAVAAGAEPRTVLDAADAALKSMGHLR